MFYSYSMPQNLVKYLSAILIVKAKHMIPKHTSHFVRALVPHALVVQLAHLRLLAGG